MSKGIVLEKHRKFTIVMTRDGSFQKVKPVRNAEIGSEVSYKVFAAKTSGLLFFQSKKSSSLRYVAIACMIMLLVLPFYFLGGQNKTYAYVNLDINPSLQIEIDSDLSVVSISPLNDDAKKLIQQLPNYEDKKVEQVIEIIMNKSDALGLIKNGKNVLVGVSYATDQTTSVLDKVDNYFVTRNKSWDMATFKVPKEVRERAKKQNISMNKVMINAMEDVADSEKMVIQTRVNDDEKELIHSFYSNSRSNHQNTGKNEVISTEQSDTTQSTVVPEQKKTKQHPSELKKQNGELHSEGKNKNNRSYNAEKKEKADKEKKKQSKQSNKHKKDSKVKKDRKNNSNHGNHGYKEKHNENKGNNKHNGNKGNNKHKDK